MKYTKGTLGLLVAILIMGTGMNAFGFLGFGGDSWREEVLLHDGQKIIVKRSVDRGGRHEIGQKPPYKEQSLVFTMPGTNQQVRWEDKFSEDLGMANFLPMLLDVYKGLAYLVTSPMGCLSYNKWGRPNPPYVVFKYNGKMWQRIPLEDLPPEIKTPNLIFSMPDIEVERAGTRFMTAEKIKSIISDYPQPEYKTILREPVKPGSYGSSVTCPDYNSQQYRSFKAPLPMKPTTEKQ
ncbi:MAG: hypothetical protein ACYC2W_06340 [Desulfurivibrionaceae bacterium]